MPEQTIRLLSDLVFVPGEHEQPPDRLPGPGGRARGAARAAGPDARRRQGPPPRWLSARTTQPSLPPRRRRSRAPRPRRSRAILALQQSAGNRAVTAMLQRQGAPAAPPAPAAGTQAASEAEAAASIGELRTIHRDMLRSPEQRIKNTAQMMDPPGERAGRPACPRDADDAALGLGADRGPQRRPTRRPPATTSTARRQDNEHEDQLDHARHRSRATGTIVIRGEDPSAGPCRAARRHRRHVRARDEPHHRLRLRRAPGDRHRLGQLRPLQATSSGRTGSSRTAASARSRPTPRADAIRNKLVGASAGAGDYEDLDHAFWAAPHATNTFRASVLAHRRPDGFNLDNSPYLDRLVHLLRDVQAGRSTVGGRRLPDHGPLPRRTRPRPRARR